MFISTLVSVYWTNTQGREKPSLEDEITENMANTVIGLIEYSSFIFIGKDIEA